MLSTHVLSILILCCSLLSSAGSDTPRPPALAATESIQLADLHEDFQLFEDEDRYDYLKDDFKYSVIGDEDFDDVFYRSALLAGRLYQLRETSSRYQDGRLEPGTSQDTDFLALMSMEALQSLPSLSADAQALSSQIDDLDPKQLGRFQKIKAVRGLNRARKNIKMVLDTQGDIDDLLGDFKTLQADLETIEDEEGDS